MLSSFSRMKNYLALFLEPFFFIWLFNICFHSFDLQYDKERCEYASVCSQEKKKQKSEFDSDENWGKM